MPVRIALNFMRPDANRPGNYDFVNHGPWLVGEFKRLGVKWNRLAFSWVVIQPEEKRYDWTAYDRIVDACEKNGIEPPLTGKLSINPWADFNLSGQFGSETWGMISPGMPQMAARLSLYYTHVSIEGEPSQSAQMFATMIATAYLTADMEKILEAGEVGLPPECRATREFRAPPRPETGTGALAEALAEGDRTDQ